MTQFRPGQGYPAPHTTEEALRAIKVPTGPAPGATSPQMTQTDPWRMTEWNTLPDECLIDACDNTEIDRRGPVWLRGGEMRKACTEHWEGIFRVLGEQATWERTDAARTPAVTDTAAGGKP